MERIKILHVISWLGSGGSQKQLYELLSGADRERFEHTVLTMAGGGFWKERVEGLGIPVIEIERKGGREVSRLVKAFRHIGRIDPHIVQTFSSGNLYGRVGAILNRVPIIISAERNIHPDKGAFKIMMDRLLAPFTDAVICNSKALAEHAKKEQWLGNEKVRIIYNGLDPSRFEVVERPRGEKLTFGTVGRLVPNKDQKTFLKAAEMIYRRHPETKFMIVGGGELEGKLKSFARELGIAENVDFTGEIRNIPDILSSMDVFVLSSVTESFPNVLMEAMAAGLPCVATDAGGVSELVLDGETGFVVRVSSPEAVAEKALFFIENNDKIKEMGLSGRRRIEASFSLGNLVDNTENLYEELIEEHLK